MNMKDCWNASFSCNINKILLPIKAVSAAKMNMNEIIFMNILGQPG